MKGLAKNFFLAELRNFFFTSIFIHLSLKSQEVNDGQDIFDSVIHDSEQEKLSI